MTDEWYYAHNANRLGPFSGRQLKELAALGTVLLTDTVWKKGVEKGALARNVKNLFPLLPARVVIPLENIPALAQLPALADTILRIAESNSSPPPVVPPLVHRVFSADLAILSATTSPAVDPPFGILAEEILLANPDEALPREYTVAPSHQQRVKPNPARNGRAMAIKGADIVSQDGIQAKFRKKCTECGHKDSSCQTITICSKTTTAIYYCPKCKKKRDVIIKCVAG